EEAQRQRAAAASGWRFGRHTPIAGDVRPEHFGSFGQVALPRRDRGYALRTKPRPDAIDETAEIGFGSGVPGKIGLHRMGRRCRHNRQARHVEPEADIEVVSEAREFLAKKPQDQLWGPYRAGRADADPDDGAIDAEKGKLEKASPFAMPLETSGKGGGERR